MDKALFAEEPDRKLPTSKDSPTQCTCGTPKRFIIVAFLALGMGFIHAMRVNVAVTAAFIMRRYILLDHPAKDPDVYWDAEKIGFLHSAFFVGYFITQLPGGYLATKIAAHKLFGACILISCSLNLLLPISMAKLGYMSTCAIRAIQGLTEGLLFPSCYAIMRHWTVPTERSRMGALVLTGTYLGPVVGLTISGMITHYIDWQYVYYIHGGMGMIWFIFWLFVAYEVPSYHPNITRQELDYILKQQGETAYLYESDRVPWFKILTSAPAWAINVCNFSRSFIFFLLMTNGPAYLNIFGFNMAENGLYSALPHLVMTLMAAASGPLADMWMADPMLTATDVRKVFTCVGLGTEAFCIFCLYFIVDGFPALVFLTIGVGISGFTISGWHINHLDIAPRYASILVAISTAWGTVAGIIIPIIVGEMTYIQSVQNWQKVFLVTSGVLLFAVVFYGLFGSAEKQSWAEPPPSEVRLISSRADPLQGTLFRVVPAQLDKSTETHQVVLQKDPRDRYTLNQLSADDSFEPELAHEPGPEVGRARTPTGRGSRLNSGKIISQTPSAKSANKSKEDRTNPFDEEEEEFDVSNPFYTKKSH